MDFDIGYHVLSRNALAERERFDTEMSIVEFLRRVEHMGDVPYDVTVTGLDSYLRGADDPEAVCEYIHRVLSERVNYLLNRNPRVQFVVDEVAFWDEPVLPADGGRIRLGRIFHNSLEHEGAGWFSSNLNVTS